MRCSMRFSSNGMAASFYSLAALAVLGVWYILLFVGDLPCDNVVENLLYVLNEPPAQLIFRWLLALPALCLLLASAYCSRWSRTRAGASILFAAGAALTLAAWWSGPAPAAAFMSLALWCGFLVLKPHLALLRLRAGR